MRDVHGVIAGTLALAGCGEVNARPDASVMIDAAPLIDAPEIDATPACQPTVLFDGGADVAAQGWTVTMQAPATLTRDADNAHLVTTTPSGGSTSGQLLISHAGFIEAGKPFKLQVVMLVESVSPHNQLDSAAAIMGSFTPSVGNSTDRSEMIYLDAAKLGWSDDNQSFAVSITNGAYHTYELYVDDVSTAHVTIDGVATISRTGFVTNGTIAVGDQTNDPNVDSSIRIRSISKLCL